MRLLEGSCKMSDLHLYIGNRNYSTWSLRPWLALKRSGLSFETTMIPLLTEEFREKIKTISPSGLVPVLHIDGEPISDSLAISEYAAEHAPHLWPEDELLRARARSAAAAMHAAFFGIRTQLPMNLRRDRPRPSLSAAAAEEITGLQNMWQAHLSRSGGPFLFGDWSIADAFYTPVAARFRSYHITLSDAAQVYCDHLLQQEEFLEWEALARQETESIPAFDADEPGVAGWLADT